MLDNVSDVNMPPAITGQGLKGKAPVQILASKCIIKSSAKLCESRLDAIFEQTFTGGKAKKPGQ
ncbi:hypothetical protein C0991_000917, partial [Blastosporella zonata]